MRKRKIKKLPAYFIVPVIFAVLGYGVLRVALTPVWELGMAAASMMLLEDAPNFYPELTTTYDPDALKAAKTEEKWINAADVTLPRHGEHYGKLMCERIGLSAPVYWGDENRILRSGAGQYEISSLPGFGEPIIICAHNTTFFRPLKKAEKDDVIVFDTNYDTYRYQVTEVSVLEEKELAKTFDTLLTASDSEETLLLYTCYPFHAISGRKTKRFCVFGKRIEGADVKWGA